jgi:hypothetical protein
VRHTSRRGLCLGFQVSQEVRPLAWYLDRKRDGRSPAPYQTLSVQLQNRCILFGTKIHIFKTIIVVSQRTRSTAIFHKFHSSIDMGNYSDSDLTSEYEPATTSIALLGEHSLRLASCMHRIDAISDKLKQIQLATTRMASSSVPRSSTGI